MDRRSIGMAALALVVGIGVLFAETTLAGLLAAQSGPIMPRDITLGELQWRGLWHSALFIWALPSALGALLIACFKPRNWRLYSLCAMLPGLAELILGGVPAAQAAIPPVYYLLSSVANLALLPLFLWLFYAIVRRHCSVGA